MTVASLLVLSGLLLPQLANPKIVEFTASTDHKVVDKYILGFFLPTNLNTPVLTIDIGKPVPDDTGKITVGFNTVGLQFGKGVVARVEAIAAGVSSGWSAPSNSFDRIPEKPTAVTIKLALTN